MSNRTASKQHWYAAVEIMRPKSKLWKRRNKANLRAIAAERNEKRFSLYEKAVSKLSSKI